MRHYGEMKEMDCDKVRQYDKGEEMVMHYCKELEMVMHYDKV